MSISSQSIVINVNCDFFSKDLSTLTEYSQASIKTTAEATMDYLDYLTTITDQLGHPKWAIVSGSELNSAMVRRLIFLMENLPIDIREFESTDEALAWLKI